MNPTRRAVLESVKRVREANETHKHAPFARHTMRIPIEDYRALVMLIPALGDYDNPENQQRAWDAFELSPLSAPYRVGAIHRGVIKNGAITK